MTKETAMKILKELHDNSLFSNRIALETLIPELADSNDERIRKCLIDFFEDWHENRSHCCGIAVTAILAWLEKQVNKVSPTTKEEPELISDWITWINEKRYSQKDVDDAYLKGVCETKQELEKQGIPAKLSEEEQNSFVKGVLSRCALSFIDYLDIHRCEGKMCVSNGECEDIDYAFHNAMWDRLHRYYCKYIEKQSSSSAKWKKNSADNKPPLKNSVLIKTINGFAEGEWQGEHWLQYRWSGILKDSDVLYWMELSELEKLGKEEQ